MEILFFLVFWALEHEERMQGACMRMHDDTTIRMPGQAQSSDYFDKVKNTLPDV